MGDALAGAPATGFLDLPIQIQATILHMLDTPTQKSLRSTCSDCVRNLTSYMCPSISISLAACPSRFVSSLLAYPRTAARLKKLKLQWGSPSHESGAGRGSCGPRAQASRRWNQALDQGDDAAEEQLWHLIDCLEAAMAEPRAQEMLAGVEELVLQGQLLQGQDLDFGQSLVLTASKLAHRLFLACPRLGTLVEAPSVTPALYVGIRIVCLSMQRSLVGAENSHFNDPVVHLFRHTMQSLGAAHPPHTPSGVAEGGILAAAAIQQGSTGPSTGPHSAQHNCGASSSAGTTHRDSLSTANSNGGATPSRWADPHSGPHSLHTLQLPETQWIARGLSLVMLANGLQPTQLQHLRLGHVRSGMKRGSVDFSQLSKLTGLKTLQLACDERQDGLDSILSNCTQLTQLEVSHWWPHLVPLRAIMPNPSLQRILVSHSFSLASLPSVLDATTTSLREICLLHEATWGGAGNGLNEPLPPALAARLSDMTFTWGPLSVGMTIDAMNRGLILPCTKALSKLRPYTNISMAHGVRRLHLESVGFAPRNMTALCELVPNVRVASFDSCVLSGGGVLEAVQGWEGLQVCTFLGEEEDNFGLGDEPGSSSVKEDLMAVKEVLQARRVRRPLTLVYGVFKKGGWGSVSEYEVSVSSEPVPRAVNGLVRPLLEGCAQVTLRVSVDRE